MPLFIMGLIAAVVGYLFFTYEPPTPEQIEQQAVAKVVSNSTESTLIAVVAGCQVWRVKDSEYNREPYFAKCDGKAVGAHEEHSRQSGKTSTTEITTSIGE